MNEVRSAQLANQALVNSASSTGAKEIPANSSGKTLPANTVKAAELEASQIQSSSPAKLQSAVANVNDYVQSIQRDLQFSVDDELAQTVIKVVDSDSGELIRQIPEDIFLELARRLNDDGEFQLLNALG